MSRLAWSLSIVSFYVWLLFPSMHVASGDRFVFFKADGDRRDDSFFFYRTGYRMAGIEERPQKKVAPKNSLTFSLFSCRRLYRVYPIFSSKLDYPCVASYLKIKFNSVILLWQVIFFVASCIKMPIWLLFSDLPRPAKLAKSMDSTHKSLIWNCVW